MANLTLRITGDNKENVNITGVTIDGKRWGDNGDATLSGELTGISVGTQTVNVYSKVGTAPESLYATGDVNVTGDSTRLTVTIGTQQTTIAIN